MKSAATLLALAVLALLNGVDTDHGVSVWRVAAYPLLAVIAYLHGRHLVTCHGGRLFAAVAIVGAVATAPIDPWESVSALISLCLSGVLPWLAGGFRRQQALLVEAGRRDVERLIGERAQVAERARAAERARIATDMHDSIGHGLALIAVRAGALEVAKGLSDEHREDVAELRRCAVDATDRLRQAISVLRDPGNAAPLTPAHEPLAEIVHRVRDAGMEVRLADEAGPVTPLVEHALRRVVQEALTNAARYAPGAPVTVSLVRSGGSVELTIVNGPATGSPSSPGTRSGIIALRERLRVLGGEFEAGPTGDGFRVAARIPEEGCG
ncbi:sensor histidine kinase [Stackebrandtia soli]|uniref:sensor histidine kinase n=1 Tax=Stackebrandtia soli TaxID=1892856 RepID=UPI0039E9D418